MKSQQNKIVIVSGGFDPIHSGHITYLNAAKALGGMLIVGLNSDGWLVRKKRKPFMTFTERYAIVSHLKMVDDVYSFYDGDNTAKDLILQVRSRNPNSIIVFDDSIGLLPFFIITFPDLNFIYYTINFDF